MNYLAIALFALLCVNLSVQWEPKTDYKLGPLLNLRPMDIVYKQGTVSVQPYRNMTNTDVKNSQISYDKLKKLWAANITKVDPIEKQNISLKIVCGAMTDMILLERPVITQLKHTKLLPLILRSEYPQHLRRLDMQLTIPRVTLYSHYKEERLHANGSFITSGKNVVIDIAMQLVPTKKDRYNIPHRYRIDAIEAKVKVPVVEFRLATNPEDTEVEKDVQLVQFGVDVVTDSVKDTLGEYLTNIFGKYLNDIMP